MKKLIIFCGIIIINFWFSISSSAQADVINPEFLSKSCENGEIEVACKFSRESIDGPMTKNTCTQYENNPDYTYLSGTGSTFGGQQKYCYKPVNLSDKLIFYAKPLIILIGLTLIIELSLFYIANIRNKSDLLKIACINILTVSLIYLTLTFLFKGIVAVAISEIAVIITEVFLIKAVTKMEFKKIILLTIVVNLVSGIGGTLIYAFLSS